MTRHSPSELVMMGAAVGLPYAGISEDVFNPAAPLSGCRLCGAVYQTPLHRELYRLRYLGESDEDHANLLQQVLDLNNEWRANHTKANHSEDEVEQFSKTGFAFTPEAANVLAPFGIFPLGKMHVDIDDAMFDAPRAPDLTHLEGGE